jgi:aconitate hydratase
VQKKDFNSYGSRRANHEIMARGTFANVRLRNMIAPGTEGGYSKHMPDGKVDFMFETAERYQNEDVPLIVIAGKDYGMGSSRDWAAKGPLLLGVKAVIAESFERIHRSNLVGMGIVPLQFEDGQNAASLGLDGSEVYDIDLSGLSPKKLIPVTATKADGSKVSFKAVCRADVPIEIQYIANGGILPFVLRRMIA